MIAKKILLSIVALAVVVSGLAAGLPTLEANAASQVECRYGITVANWVGINLQNKSVESYDLPMLGTGYYLDWGIQRSPTVPKTISYVNVLNVRDSAYSSVMGHLKSRVENNPGAIWIVGNEPDDRTGQQDDVYAEVYAERFFDYAKIIRATDPTAKITFGTIIMSTTLRIMYLQRAWDRLVVLAGSRANASALVDVWTPHGFILNEEQGGWGSGIPLGFDNLAYLQEKISIFDMNSVPMFQTRMLRFRQFMKDNGEQNKPLWLTEWGVLAPSQNPPNSTIKYFTLPETATAKFFSDTVDWMESYKDPALGMAADDNRLFQKWFWYSLNDPLYHFGGSLVDPITLKTTIVGANYINYEPPAGTEPFLAPDLEPISVKAVPLSRNPLNRELVNYRFDVRIRNNVVQNHLTDVNFNLYDENNQYLGSASAKVNRCGGDVMASVFQIQLLPTVHNIKVTANAVSTIDVNAANNEKIFTISLGLPFEAFTPIER